MKLINKLKLIYIKRYTEKQIITLCYNNKIIDYIIL